MNMNSFNWALLCKCGTRERLWFNLNRQENQFLVPQLIWIFIYFFFRFSAYEHRFWACIERKRNWMILTFLWWFGRFLVFSFFTGKIFRFPFPRERIPAYWLPLELLPVFLRLIIRIISRTCQNMGFLCRWKNVRPTFLQGIFFIPRDMLWPIIVSYY